MIQSLVATFARLAVERRGAILILFFLVTLGFASALPSLKVDTSPEALVSEIEGQDQAEALFQKHFGRSESQIIVALSGDDLLSREALAYQFRLQRALSKLQTVASVDGITHSPLPAEFFDPPSDQQVPQALPPEQAIQADLQLQQAIAAARKQGKFPSEATLAAIVKNEPTAYPNGVKTLTARLLGAKSVPPFTEQEWSDSMYQELVQGIERATWLRPVLLSRDGSASALILNLDKSQVFNESTRMEALKQVRLTVLGVDNPTHIKVSYGGSPVLGEAILRKLERDRLTLNPAMGILCLLVLWFTFRWWPAVVAPLIAVAVACVGVMGMLALLNQPLTILTNIIPPLLLIVGLSDSVHLLGRYREELGLVPDPLLAAKRATVAMVVACFLTSLTTAVGFGSMVAAKTEELQRFGWAASFGVMLAYFATVFCVPAFISFFKVPASWQEQHNSRSKPRKIEKAIAGVAIVTMRHHKLVAGLAVVSTVVLSYLASQVQADARLLDAFDRNEDVHVVTTMLEDKLAGIRPLEVLISMENGALLSPEVTDELARAEQWLNADPQVITVASYLNPLRALRSSLSLGKIAQSERFDSPEQTQALSAILQQQKKKGQVSYINGDLNFGRMTVFFKDSGVRHTLEVVRKLEAELRDKLGKNHELKLTFLGEAYTGSLGREHVLRDLLSGLALALVTIFGLLTILFRSLPLGLVAMPPNVIPLLATGAYMMARGIQLNLTTVITFSIGIGLAVDDTVHVVARFREESARITSKRVALLRAVRGTGTSIFVTAVSLALGFAVLMLSEFVSVRQFGELIAVTVVNCLIGAVFLQPALLRIVIGRVSKR